MYSLRKHRAIIYASLNTSCIVSLLSPIDPLWSKIPILGADHRRPVLLCRKIITIHCIYTEGSLYLCKSDITFRYVHRRSNLMFTLSRQRSKNKFAFAYLEGNLKLQKERECLFPDYFWSPQNEGAVGRVDHPAWRQWFHGGRDGAFDARRAVCG